MRLLLEPAQPVIFLKATEESPLGAGYASGAVVDLCTVQERSDPCLIVWAKPAIPVIPIAGVEADPSKLIVYGVEKGTKNVSGQVVKNRVAVVGIHAWGYNAITEAGEKAFKAGIEWALEEE